MKTQASLSLELNDRVILNLSKEVDQSSGDSLGLQKGLVMFVEAHSVCGEGTGFGVPAVEYSSEVLFSTTASIEFRDDELVKTYSIDAVQSKTWKDKFTIDSKIYRVVQNELANLYRTRAKLRPTLTHIMRIQSLMGIKLSNKKVKSKGLVEVGYRLSNNVVMIRIDSSRLVDRDFKRLLVFNEQSADFDLYRDDLVSLRGESIGVWEEVDSQRVSLMNEKMKVTFSIEKISGAKMYRGRELLKPRLDWAGFCYLIPPSMEHVSYVIQVV